MSPSNSRVARALACTALLLLVNLAAGSAARADAPNPLYQYYGVAKTGEEKVNFTFPPQPFEGPCGLAVDSKGNFYVADYYHHVVDAISSSRKYLTQAAKVSPSDGPCGLAVDGSGALYVNEYHAGVVKYLPSAFPLTASTTYGPATTVVEGDVTGIAVDPVSGRLYVNERTRILVFESSGAPVLDGGGQPLEIGVGSLGEGYGLAFSQFEGTAGRLYVADGVTDTVKVYDPAVQRDDPIETIDGVETPTGEFVSLRDSALAVDRITGRIYVVDLLLPVGYERPEAAVYAFAPDGSYAGRLKYNIIDARPPGLAVDNSLAISLSRVYVTTGNTEGAGVYSYASGGATTQPGSCAPEGPCPPRVQDALSSSVASMVGKASARSSSEDSKSALAGPSGGGAVVQKGTLRVRTEGKIAPSRLPRKGVAPIAVSVAGEISTTDASIPPQLERLRIEINRHGQLDYAGLPTCPYPKIQTASSSRALAACKSALVGKGSFAANIVLSGQQPYPTQGKLLVFNGEKQGKSVLYGHIYSPRPFASSFVIVFSISKKSSGQYGTVLSADLPKALGNWGYVTGIEMRLGRRYHYEGKPHSYLSSGCPAPKGFSRISFPLARTSFDFAETGRLVSTLTRECRARG